MCETSEQRRWTHFLHCKHLIELQPIHSPQTPQRSNFANVTLLLPSKNLHIYSLSDIHVQSFPIKRFLPLLILLHYLFDCFTTQIKIICIQQLQKRIIPHTLSYSIHKNDKTRSRSSKNLSFSTVGLLTCWQ